MLSSNQYRGHKEQRALIWVLRNCNMGDTDSRKTKSVPRKRKSQGLIKATATTLLKLSFKNHD